MLLNFGPTFIWTLFNLLLLYFLMRKLLFKPVTAYMDNRTKSIKDNMESAEKSKADALALKQKYEDQIKTARDEADKILDDVRARAGREYEAAVGAAKKDAEAVLIRAREEIERERAQMINEVKGQVAGLALAAASRVIEANMDTESNRVLVNKFIDEAGAA